MLLLRAPGQGWQKDRDQAALELTGSTEVTSTLSFPISRHTAKKILIFLVLLNFVLAALFLLDQLYELPRQMHKVFVGTLMLDKETSIPSWVLSMQFFLIGALFLFHRNWGKADKIANPWFMVAIGIAFIIASLDSASDAGDTLFEWLGLDVHKPKSEFRLYREHPAPWIIGCSFITLSLLTAGRQTVLSLRRAYHFEVRLMLVTVAFYFSCRLCLSIALNLYSDGDYEQTLRLLAMALKPLLDMVTASILLYATLLCAISNPGQFRNASQMETGPRPVDPAY